MILAKHLTNMSGLPDIGIQILKKSFYNLEKRKHCADYPGKEISFARIALHYQNQSQERFHSIKGTILIPIKGYKEPSSFYLPGSVIAQHLYDLSETEKTKHVVMIV